MIPIFKIQKFDPPGVPSWMARTDSTVDGQGTSPGRIGNDLSSLYQETIKQTSLPATTTVGEAHKSCAEND